MQQRLLTAGVDAWTRPNGLPEARAFLQREVEKFRMVVQRTGVKLEP